MSERDAIFRRRWRACDGGSSSGEERIRSHGARIPNRLSDCGGEDGRHVRFASHCAGEASDRVLLAQKIQVGAVRIRASKGMKLVLGPHSWNCRLPCRLPPAIARWNWRTPPGQKMRVHLKAASPPDLMRTLPELLESCCHDPNPTPQMRILVAVEPTDFRRGIDGLARVCKEVLRHDPFNVAGCSCSATDRPRQ